MNVFHSTPSQVEAEHVQHMWFAKVTQERQESINGGFVAINSKEVGQKFC